VARLAGKVAVISGGGGGIGTCISRVFAQEGAAVVVADMSTDGAEQVVAEIRSQGGRATLQALDVTQGDQVERMIQHAVKEYGRLDVLVTAQGWTQIAVAVNMSEADFDRTIATHLKGTWLLCKYALRAMLQQRAGAIVNISSMQAYRALPGRVAYEAAKGGVSAMTRQLAVEYGPSGIRVNAICPGVIMTPLLVAMNAESSAEEKRLRIESYPLRRLGTEEDVAHAALFLASEESSWITGTDLFVDGGMSIQLTEAVAYPPFRRIWDDVPGPNVAEQ
jgi:NAD(P)-dependent dehydrogenase (short-subunit alcohol dehydrogenase family)